MNFFELVYKYKIWIAIFLVLIVALIFLPQVQNITVESIVEYVPPSSPLAILVFALIYSAKAIIMFPPLKILYAAAGLIFPAGWGVVITYACLIIASTIGYSIGKRLGEERVRALISKNKKLARLLDKNNNNSFTMNMPVICYFARVISIGGDPFSMLCGAIGMPYGKYLISSLLGLSFFMLPIVLTFSAIFNPETMGFTVPIITTAVVILVSGVVYILHRKSQKVC